MPTCSHAESLLRQHELRHALRHGAGGACVAFRGGLSLPASGSRRLGLAGRSSQGLDGQRATRLASCAAPGGGAGLRIAGRPDLLMAVTAATTATSGTTLRVGTTTGIHLGIDAVLLVAATVARRAAAMDGGLLEAARRAAVAHQAAAATVLQSRASARGSLNRRKNGGFHPPAGPRRQDLRPSRSKSGCGNWTVGRGSPE